jgi:hypothetical protein
MNTPELKNINHNQLRSDSSTTGGTIQLQYPISVDGMVIESLTMRRPLVRDRLVAEKASGSEVEKEIRLIANLCEMAPQHIELLDLADYAKLQECLAGFLS